MKPHKLNFIFFLYLFVVPCFADLTFPYVLNFVDTDGKALVGLNSSLDTVRIRLYESKSETSIKYEESFSPVEVKNGLAELEIGASPSGGYSLTNLSRNRYLEISVRIKSGDAEITLLPRRSLISVPIALDAEKLQGYSLADVFNNNQDEISFYNPDVRVGIGIDTPVNMLQVEKGALCVSKQTSDCNEDRNTAGTVYAETISTKGSDYAEYFRLADEVKSIIGPGELVGLNRQNSRARPYQKGDIFLGIVPTNPGIIGNSMVNFDQHVLVAVMGQVPFLSAQVNVAEGLVFTKDGLLVGYLLEDNHVYLPAGLRLTRIEQLTSIIEQLKLSNDQLRRRLENLERKLEPQLE